MYNLLHCDLVRIFKFYIQYKNNFKLLPEPPIDTVELKFKTKRKLYFTFVKICYIIINLDFEQN